MRRAWKIVGIAALVAVLGVAAVGAVAYAQDEDDGYPFDFAGKFKEAVAGILGISVEDYDAAVEQAQDQVVDQAVTEGWLTGDQAEMLRWRMDQAPHAGMWGMGRDFGRGGPSMLGRGTNQLSFVAEALDMSLTDLLTALQEGKSIAGIAGEQGVEPQSIVDAYLAEIQADLDEAVAEGRITQNQADYQLERAEERATDLLERTWEEGFRGHGGRPGGKMGFPGLGDL
jgi:hypothetical protein